MNSNTSSSNESDKYDLVIDIVGHPEKYSSEQLKQLLSDPETREIYNLLCKTDSAVKASRPVDIEAEWQDFSKKCQAKRHVGFSAWPGVRAAAIIIIIFSSLAAVAIGIAISVSISDWKPGAKSKEAIITETHTETTLATVASVSVDTVASAADYILFEDATLREITDSIARVHSVKIIFGNKEAADLHLYYRFYPTLPLDETISGLNTFEQINITRNGNVLNID